MATSSKDLARLAAALSEQTSLSLADATRLVRAAHNSNRLPKKLDRKGFADALATLTSLQHVLVTPTLPDLAALWREARAANPHPMLYIESGRPVLMKRDAVITSLDLPLPTRSWVEEQAVFISTQTPPVPLSPYDTINPSGSVPAKALGESEDPGFVVYHVTRNDTTTTISLTSFPNTSPKLEDLGFSRKDLLAPSPGLIMIGGPTGSGKSTLAHALLLHAASTGASNIQSVEKFAKTPLTKQHAAITQNTPGHSFQDIEEGVNVARKSKPDLLYVSSIESAAALSAVLEAATTTKVVAIFAVTGIDAIRSRVASIFSEQQRQQKLDMLDDTLIASISCLLERDEATKSRRATYHLELK